MNYQEYLKYDAIGLAELVKTKQVKPIELLEIAIAQCEHVNSDINAVVAKMYDYGRKQAEGPIAKSPLAGVPFLVKDLAIEMEGTPYSAGTKAYHGYVSKTDTELGRRIREAGLITFGKTNTPEFGLTPFTEGKALGICRNPNNLDYTSGGSSGGSAAAVAAGIVPIATASDGGGSIRIPASCCGLFGLKPSRGRISVGDSYGEMWGGAVVENCVTKTVRDSAAYLDTMMGPGIGEPYIVGRPDRPYLQEVGREPDKLKIGFCLTHPLGQPIDSENRAAIEKTTKLLASLGHEVEEVSLPYDLTILTDLLFTMVASETAVEVENTAKILGRKPRLSDVESNTWMLAKIGNAISGRDVAFQKRRWNDVSRQCGQFHLKYDLMLTPTLGRRPARIGELQNSKLEDGLLSFANTLGISSLIRHTNVVDQVAEKLYGFIPYTPAANLTGQPAMSVPIYRTKENLPIGAMFTAAMGRDDLLFQLAGQLEEHFL